MDDKPYYLIGDVDIRNMDEYKPFKEVRHKNARSTIIFVESL